MRLWYCVIFFGLIGRMVLAQELELPTLSQLNETDTFRVAGLTASEQMQIFKEIEKISFDVPDSWEKELLVRRLSLGNTEGLVLQGRSLLCGGTGNCETFVLRREKSKWISMFHEEAPLAEGFGVLPDASNGVKHFVIIANTSAESGQIVIYKFDGKFYRTSHCYEKSKTHTKAVSCK
jgi:hypothetical protein